MDYSEKRIGYLKDFLATFILEKQMQARRTRNRRYLEDLPRSNFPPPHSAPYDTEIAVRQIRLLSGTERVTYVAIIGKWGEDAFLVIPFSSFDSPATELELLLNPTQDHGLFLRVLQIWNTRSLHREVLQKGWIAENLSDQEFADVKAMVSWRFGGEKVNVEILERTGIPILRKDDPRREYKKDERKNFSAIDEQEFSVAFRNEPPASEGDDRHPGNFPTNIRLIVLWNDIEGWMPKSRDKAQENVFWNTLHPGYITRDLDLFGNDDIHKSWHFKLRKDNQTYILEIDYSSSLDSLTFKTLTEQNKPTSDLDGWEIKTTQEESLGKLQNGSLTVLNFVPSGQNGRFILRSPDGTDFTLEKM